MTTESKSAPGWDEAVAELEAILQAIEDEEVSVDVLGEQVERAAALIRHCRGVLSRTELRVREAIASLEELEDPEADGDA